MQDFLAASLDATTLAHIQSLEAKLSAHHGAPIVLVAYTSSPTKPLSWHISQEPAAHEQVTSTPH